MFAERQWPANCPTSRRAAMLAIAATVLSTCVLGSCANRSITGLDSPLPNQVMMGRHITTAGQPSRAQLLRLNERGIRVVVHLATVAPNSAVSDEHQILERQGLTYVRLDLDANNLSIDDLAVVSSVLSRSADRSVLVHCDMNILAATFVFLYRVIDRREELQLALSDLELVTVPRGAVLRFINSQLTRIGASLEGGGV